MKINLILESSSLVILRISQIYFTISSYKIIHSSLDYGIYENT